VDEDFSDLFSNRGQPGWSAWRLALICVMQFLEELTDCQAAEAVRGRIDCSRGDKATKKPAE
jgi:hypothetical protein